MIEVVEHLLDRYVLALASRCETDGERETFFAVCDPLSYSQLLELVNAETVALLREHISNPASLVLTLN